MKTRLFLIFALACVAFGVVGAASGTRTSSVQYRKEFLWPKGSTQAAAEQDQVQNNLIYHGGNVGPDAIGVEQNPSVYLIWWGPQWKEGFTTPDTNGKLYSSKTLQTYLASFFQNVGGSGWANTQTQYCAYALAGSMNCNGGGGFVTNPKGQLKGVWTDTTPVPNYITGYGLGENLVDDPIASAAVRGMQHFGYHRDATYIVLTPPGPVATGQPVYCGYHTQTTGVDGIGNAHRIQYAFIPWLNTNWPGFGVDGCGMHNVNATSTAFGNGIFDGWTIVTGHEYSEAITDPDNFTSIQDGWNDDSTSENADKCAWNGDQNIVLGGKPYAVQPMWSNRAYDATGTGCVISEP